VLSASPRPGGACCAGRVCDVWWLSWLDVQDVLVVLESRARGARLLRCAEVHDVLRPLDGDRARQRRRAIGTIDRRLRVGENLTESGSPPLQIGGASVVGAHG